jgi:hypothetical protein
VLCEVVQAMRCMAAPKQWPWTWPWLSLDWRPCDTIAVRLVSPPLCCESTHTTNGSRKNASRFGVVSPNDATSPTRGR